MTSVNFYYASNLNASTYHSSMTGMQGERLHQIVVFELREDGNTHFSTMTLRSLYNYVVRTITEGCREANRKKHQELQQQEMQQRQYQKNSGRETVRGSLREKRSMNDVFLEDVEEEVINNEHNQADVEKVKRNNIEEWNGSSNNDDENGATFPATPTPTNVIPPHFLPSLMSSSNTTGTPHQHQVSGDDERQNEILSSDGSQRTSDRIVHNTQHQHSDEAEEERQTYLHDMKQVHLTSWQSTPHIPSSSPLLLSSNNTYRERLGGYLHPRDMRRLVTPFSSSNEPQLIVRRHVMLLNFDPLRAIVLRDRLLVLVPDGADSILVALERRVRGGVTEMVNQVFGTASVHDMAYPGGMSVFPKKNSYDNFASEQYRGGRGTRKGKSSSEHDENYLMMESSIRFADNKHNINDEDNETYITASSSDNNTNNFHDRTTDEWEEMQRMDWQHLPFELQSVDAVLQTVISMLIEDAQKVHDKAGSAMGELRGESPSKGSSRFGSGGGTLGDFAQERLRLHKDAVNLTERRVQGFVRAMNELLDEDEDMALMNLSRLLSHPERFVQPVSRVILHEESDEPELILEAYLQQALSIVNSLDLLKGQIATTEEQISMTLDAIRNRLLYINTLLSVAMLCVSTGAFVGSIFGMNLYNHIEEDDTAFYRVTYGTLAGILAMWVILSWVFFRAANVQSNWGRKNV